MKHPFKPLATALAATLQLTAIAAVPLSWDARPGNPAPASFDRYHGEALEFRCTFRGFGELPFVPGADIRLWYQTNGMGSAWWSVPATIQSNVLSATWSPALDPGADRVSLFFGAPSNAYASAVLRLRHSPGFAPGAMPDPETFHESDPVFSAWLSAFQESDPVFSSWLATNTPPETSLEPSTNYTSAALGAFAATGTVARANVYGTPTRWTDATGRVWEVGYSDWVIEYNDPAMAYYGVRLVESGQGDGAYWIPYVGEEPSGVAKGYADSTEIVWLNEAIADFRATRTLLGTTNLVGRVALTNDIPPSVSNVVTGAYVESLEGDPLWSADKPNYARHSDLTPIEQDIADLRTESSLVYRLYQGSNVVVEVTNYSSQVNAPELKIMQLNESNEYITVWAETNGLARTLARAKEYADGAIADRAAPRAWSKVTSGMGVEAPSNTTWLSTGRTVIAGGLEYEKHLTSGGAIWLLESNGMAADFHPQTNNTAFIDLSNADGTPIFRVEKTDSFLVGVHIDCVTVDGNALVCRVGVVASEHPYVRISTDLKTWLKEEDGIPSSLATVTWSGSAGNWTCRIANNTGGTPFFANMQYMQEGGTKIVNSAPLDVSAGILCTDGIHKVRPVYNSGTITWEVVP